MARHRIGCAGLDGFDCGLLETKRFRENRAEQDPQEALVIGHRAWCDAGGKPPMMSS